MSRTRRRRRRHQSETRPASKASPLRFFLHLCGEILFIKCCSEFQPLPPVLNLKFIPLKRPRSVFTQLHHIFLS